ncbi:MAG: hypothetical protein KAR87_04135 [Candidatus Aenigmarchaeota archaeon]|nr:hypothetical protein [Candidatus Aenigmarchaeota archaeon]
MANVTNLLLGNLTDIGFFELLLPWILFFTLLYVVFKKTNLFVEETQNITLSLALSLFIVNFTPLGLSFANILSRSFGFMALGMVFILIAWVFCGMLGVDTISLVRDNRNIFFAIGVLFAFIVSVKIMGNYIGDISDMLVTLFFVVCIFGGMYYVTKS